MSSTRVYTLFFAVRGVAGGQNAVCIPVEVATDGWFTRK